MHDSHPTSRSSLRTTFRLRKACPTPRLITCRPPPLTPTRPPPLCSLLNRPHGTPPTTRPARCRATRRRRRRAASATSGVHTTLRAEATAVRVAQLFVCVFVCVFSFGRLHVRPPQEAVSHASQTKTRRRRRTRRIAATRRRTEAPHIRAAARAAIRTRKRRRSVPTRR